MAELIIELLRCLRSSTIYAVVYHFEITCDTIEI